MCGFQVKFLLLEYQDISDIPYIKIMFICFGT